MSQEIWDQGRVVGYSSYEIYLKKHFEKYPDIDPPSEEQWLASSLAMGQSMIVSVPNTSDTPTSYWEIIKTDGDYKVMDLYFSEKFKMVAANNIIGSFFSGTVQLHDSSKFASWVASYGPLVGNENTIYPTGTKGEKDAVDPRASVATSDTMKGMLTDYMKILDAVIIQPGTWRTTGTPRPKTELKPDFTEKPRLRLLIKGEITTSPKILLTGFSYASQVAGVSKDNGAVNTSNRANGDFLGPEVFPWCSKVTLTIPTLYTEIAGGGGGGVDLGTYGRQIPPGSPSGPWLDPNSEAMMDFTDWDPLVNYYNQYKTEQDAKHDPTKTYEDRDPRIDMAVNGVETSKGGIQGFTMYSRSSTFPPVLYAHKFETNGTTSLIPVDSPSIGSAKVFENDLTNAKAYYRAYPGVQVFNRAADGQLYQMVRNYKGTSSNALTDGGDQMPQEGMKFNDMHRGDVWVYGSQEFIWTDTARWKAIPAGSCVEVAVSRIFTNTLSIDWDSLRTDSAHHLSDYFKGEDGYEGKLLRINAGRIYGGNNSLQVMGFEALKCKEFYPQDSKKWNDPANWEGAYSGEDHHLFISTIPRSNKLNASDPGEGTQYRPTALQRRVITTEAIPANQRNLTWGALIAALANDVAIDILGDDLKLIRDSLPYGYMNFGKRTFLGVCDEDTFPYPREGGIQRPKINGQTITDLHLGDTIVVTDPTQMELIWISDPTTGTCWRKRTGGGMLQYCWQVNDAYTPPEWCMDYGSTTTQILVGSTTKPMVGPNHNVRVDWLEEGDCVTYNGHKYVWSTNSSLLTRLYVSNTAPVFTNTNPIPEGSIGIGW